MKQGKKAREQIQRKKWETGRLRRNWEVRIERRRRRIRRKEEEEEEEIGNTLARLGGVKLKKCGALARLGGALQGKIDGDAAEASHQKGEEEMKGETRAKKKRKKLNEKIKEKKRRGVKENCTQKGSQRAHSGPKWRTTLDFSEWSKIRGVTKSRVGAVLGKKGGAEKERGEENREGLVEEVEKERGEEEQEEQQQQTKEIRYEKL